MHCLLCESICVCASSFCDVVSSSGDVCVCWFLCACESDMHVSSSFLSVCVCGDQEMGPAEYVHKPKFGVINKVEP